MPLELVPVVERTRLVDPAGAPAEQVIEHRVDPLLGTVASINAALGEKARAFLGGADLALLQDLEERSRATCPFCAAAEKGTRFPPALVPEGQLRIGDALAMPNLFSKAGLDCVVVVDPARHVLFPSRIREKGLADAVRAAAELVRRARRDEPARVHHVAGMNFLAPGGSSVPHPHLQVHARSVPYSGIARAMALAAAHLDRKGRGYFEELLETERALGVRHLGRTGSVEWVVAWAPAHQREVWGILPSATSLVELDDAAAEGFAAGISRVISFYEEAGVHPFTLAFMSSPAPGARGWALHVKICSRPALRAMYANYDSWFGPKLVGDDAHVEAPESYAAALRARW
jgi:galactose-1-phosphate uridylyltransferase